MRNLLVLKQWWEKKAGNHKNGINEFGGGIHSSPKGLRYFENWLSGEKRKLVDGTCRVDV